MGDVAPWIGIGISSASLCFAFLAWDVNRPRAAWRLSAAAGGVAVLTYIGWRRQVTVVQVHIPHRMPLQATDLRAELEGRSFNRFSWAQLDVSDCTPGDVVVVTWRGRWRNRTRHDAFPLTMG
ncbi:hypothetical protein ACXIZN_37035 [Amycolatopsis sp. TRM77291]